MFANGPIIFEGLLVGGGVLAWGFWELRSLAKLRRAREAAERGQESAGSNIAGK